MALSAQYTAAERIRFDIGEFLADPGEVGPYS